jgi:CTP-dependent riboflavin kinase
MNIFPKACLPGFDALVPVTEISKLGFEVPFSGTYNSLDLQAFVEGDTVTISSGLAEYHGIMMNERTFGPVLSFAKEIARIPGAVVQGRGLGMDI